MEATLTPQPTLERVLAALDNPRALERGMLLIAGRQTMDERMDFTTKYDNDVGFEAWAAQKGTRIANAIAEGKRLEVGTDWYNFAKKVLTRNKWQLLEEAWKKWWKANESVIVPGTILHLAFGFTLTDGTRLRRNNPLVFMGFAAGDGPHEGKMHVLDAKGRQHYEVPSNIFRRMREVSVNTPE